MRENEKKRDTDDIGHLKIPAPPPHALPVHNGSADVLAVS